MEVLVRELMTCDPLTIQESQSVRQATEFMVQEGLSILYVADMTGRVVGVVSDYELLKMEFASADCSQPISSIMRRSLVTFAPDDTANSVAGLFRDGRYSEGIVVENGQAVGRIHRRDVLRMIVANQQCNIDGPHDNAKNERPRPRMLQAITREELAAS